MRFSDIVNPTALFGAVLINRNHKVRFGAVSESKTSYGAVR